MKTCLFTTSYLDGSDRFGCDRLERTMRYLSYYRALKDELGFQDFWMTENGSEICRVAATGGTIWHESGTVMAPGAPDLNIWYYEKGLYKVSDLEFPYCWRGTYFLKYLMDLGYEKIITCDTDAFILSGKLASYIKNLDSGYTAMWSPRYQFPAAEITILCKDAFPALREWMDLKSWSDRCDEKRIFEAALPFTHFCKDFKGDRYGEFKIQDKEELGWPQDASMDYYTQAQLKIPMEFRK